MDYIFDGEVHALDKELAYIIKKIEGWPDDTGLEQEVRKLYCSYAKYLFQNDEEKAIDCITNWIIEKEMFNNEDATVVVTPPWIVGALHQHGTIGMKFTRSPNDNLGEK